MSTETTASGTNFLPSSVDSKSVIPSSFGNMESEIAAMAITGLLASLQTVWKFEFSLADLTDWVNTKARDALNVYYLGALSQYGSKATQLFIQGVRRLIEGGYLTCDNRNEMDYLTVTDKFVEKMRRFAS